MNTMASFSYPSIAAELRLNKYSKEGMDEAFTVLATFFRGVLVTKLIREFPEVRAAAASYVARYPLGKNGEAIKAILGKVP